MAIGNAKALIRESYLKMYKEYSPAYIKANMLYECAHISRSTFYKCYHSADSVLREIENEVEEEMNHIYDNENYQRFTEISIDVPPPNFREMFKCVQRHIDLFAGALSDHGNQAFVARAKKNIRMNIYRSLKDEVSDPRQLEFICDFAADYILMCCKELTVHRDKITINGLSVVVKKAIVDLVLKKEYFYK